MAAPLLNRSPTCLSCLRRLTSPIASSTWAPLSATAPHIQIRGKKKTTRRQDHGIIVRLLEDIPKFGRKDAIFPVERGRMRNQWYPSNKAEYMTAARFQELGLTRDDVGERDTLFGTAEPVLEDLEVVEEPQAPAIEIQGLAAERAHALLSFLVPETLVFSRKLIPHTVPIYEPPQLVQPRSPLLAANASLSTSSSGPEKFEKPEKPEKPAPVVEPAPSPLAIFGSVSSTDVVAAIKALLITDPEASRISLEPGDVRFVGLEDGADRVKSLGTWSVEIAVAGRGPEVEPIRKVVEVVAGE